MCIRTLLKARFDCTVSFANLFYSMYVENCYSWWPFVELISLS